MNRKQDPLEEALSRHLDPLKNRSQRLAAADKERLLKNILCAGAGQQTAAIPRRERWTRFLVAAAAVVVVAIAVFSWNLQRSSRSEVSLKNPNDKERVLAAGLVLPAAQDTGLLRGTVLDNVSSSPISDVHIFIGRGAANPEMLDTMTKLMSFMLEEMEWLQDVLNDEKDEGMRNGNFKLLTGSDGHFTIQNMPAGAYTVVAYRQGYVGAGTLTSNPELGGASLIALATVHITSQQTSEVTLKLAHGGALSGRVIGLDGKPKANIEVAVSTIQYDDKTGDPLLLSVKEGKSDDRGEFRIFHIPPGEYYLAASPPRGEFGELVRGDIAKTYYPSATSTKDTRLIAIRAGDDLAGLDIHLQQRTVPGFTVSGRVISLLPADEPVPQGAEAAAKYRNFAFLRIAPREENPNWGREMRFAPSLAQVDVSSPVNGAFELAGIPPGSYDVYAVMTDVRGVGDAAKNYYGGMAWGRAAFEVHNGNVSGITVTVHRSLDVGGQVFVDGSPSAVPVQLKLHPLDRGAIVQLAHFGQIDAAQIRIEHDGSFIIHGVPAVPFRPQASIKGSGLPASAYVADIRQGGRSVYDDGFTAGPVAASPLEVVINTKGGTVEGVVDRAKAFVALVPPPGRQQNGDLYKTVVTNAQRQFRFEGVPPGSYKLFAWDNIPANAHRNQDFMKAYESRGASITVQAGAAVFQKLEVLVSP